MNIDGLLGAIENSTPAEWMRSTVAAMPVVESIHVLAAVTVLGTLLIVDLRLLGLPDARREVTRVARELLPITWIAFGTAVATGSLMFSTSAHTYFGNTAFRLKMLALLCAGLNMAAFQLVTFRGVARWNRSAPPTTARIAGAVSLLLWASVVLLGRWIGFTKGYDFSIPEGVDLGLAAGN